jgi:type IV pilus assembly protein PilA
VRLADRRADKGAVTHMRLIRDQRGFTLIELLVVILIIGILAAIAIPSFISQKDKANDASAKSFARNMRTAQEAYFTDHDAYTSSVAALQALDGALNDAPSGTPPAAAGGPSTFSVTATSKTGVAYTIDRAADGTVTRSCTPVAKGGCNAGGSW